MGWLTAPLNSADAISLHGDMSQSETSISYKHMYSMFYQWHFKCTQTLWQEPEAKRSVFHLLTANTCLSTAACEQMKADWAAAALLTEEISDWLTAGRETHRTGWMVWWEYRWSLVCSESVAWISLTNTVGDEWFIPLFHAAKWPRHPRHLGPPVSSASHSNKD